MEGYVLEQQPGPGSHLIYREGDFLTVRLHFPADRTGSGWLRTSLYRPQMKHQELIERVEDGMPRRFREWGDLPMHREEDATCCITLPLVTVGFFEAKAYFLPEDGDEPIWPEGDNLFIKVEPADSVISNSIYSAFVRLFIGEEAIARIRSALESMEHEGKKDFSMIPQSGKFRDLAAKVDFIVDELGFDIIMLLPVHPVPTTYARMGLFGSPYAALDFLNVDPALAEFDKLTTPMEQFGELIDRVHAKHARIFMDIPVNHTGWASQLQVHHPEYFVKTVEGKFVSPGAWGVTWSDLAKLDYSHRGLWEYMAETFLFWCNKGVDGFRCDAGYMIPPEAWRYITARVRSQYPSTIFLLEGLGGKVSTTEKLLTECNLNWAYSELFQNYDQGQVEWYTGEFARISFTKGPLVNFSETHDNNRLASVSQAFSRLRNGLNALLSDTGTFGITCGVEWYADEKIDVHRLTSMNWGSPENQISWIRRLNNIIKTHPSFQAGSYLQKIHASHSNAIAYKRFSPGGEHTMIVLANLSEGPNQVVVDREGAAELTDYRQDLLTGEDVSVDTGGSGLQVKLKPYQIAAICNDPGYHYQVVDWRVDGFIKEAKAERLLKLQIIKLFQSYGKEFDDHWMADRTRAFEKDPYRFFFDHFDQRPPVIQWSYPRDVKRQVIIPRKTPLLIMARYYFRYRLKGNNRIIEHGEGFYLDKEQYVSIVPPGLFDQGEAVLYLEMEVYDGEHVFRETGHLLVASTRMFFPQNIYFHDEILQDPLLSAVCVNQRAGISFARGAFSQLLSKYDGLLSANLDSRYPEDRHLMLSRLRGWSVYKGFSRAIDVEYQEFFAHQDNTTQYHFKMPAGSGLHVPLLITMVFNYHDDRLAIFIKRLPSPDYDAPSDEQAVKIILRPDIESRNHHEVTKAFAGPEEAWPKGIREENRGFVFMDEGRKLEMNLPAGDFIREDEWQYMVHRPIEQSRGMEDNSDLYSPGYFRIFLQGGEQTCIHVCAGHEGEEQPEHEPFDPPSPGVLTPPDEQGLWTEMRDSIRQFIVQRDANKTVIAGYPWFLDWGRDTLICLRGIIAASYLEEAESIIKEFAAFEHKGTLPNVIRGSDTSNRDTSDAPLWFFAAVKDLTDLQGYGILEEDCGGRSLKEVLSSIARHYMEGTPNGIRMDEESGLVYSPTHFTWMDTNYPAGTPRQGYPIEIQALWYHALRFMGECKPEEKDWDKLAGKVQYSIAALFVIEKKNDLANRQRCLSDCLHSESFEPARKARRDDHIRPNQLFAITMGAVREEDLSGEILSVCEELLIPGAIRTLADRHTSYPLPVEHEGHVLNDPSHPYQGRYVGGEDHSRKPAYHNGTAWTWPFPSYCEALFMAWGEKGRQSAANILAGSMKLYREGAVSQLPEVLDGDHPHTQRGCYAQAWGITELYRVARLLNLTVEDF
jgi:predicted glycogen debranching enzyme